MDAIQDQHQQLQDTVPFDDGDTVVLDSPLAETQVEKLDFDFQVLDDSIEIAKHELVSEVVLDSEDEEIHGEQLDNIADGVSAVEIGSRIKANGAAGLQMRQHSPRFQRVKDFAEDFVSDGSTGQDNSAEALTNGEDTDGKIDCPRLLTCDQEFASLNYVGSEEPGESSQASALDFVDHFLSCNDGNVSPRTELRNTVRKKFSPVLSASGCQLLAKRIKTRTPIGKTKTFEWVDNDQHGGVDFFSKRMNESFDSGGCQQRYVTRHQKAECIDGKGGSSSDNDNEEKSEDLHKKVTSSPYTGSRVTVHSVKKAYRKGQESEFISKNDSVNKPRDQFCAIASGHGLDICSNEKNTSDTFDVGFNTQIAAEAMEALFYGPPADSSAGEAFQDPNDSLVDPSKGVTNSKLHLNEPFNEKSALCNLEDITRVPKQGKLYARKGASSSWKQSSRQELPKDLAETTKRKRSKPLVGELTDRTSIICAKNESSATTSRKTIDQRKEEETVKRNKIKECDNYGSLSTSVSLGKQQILQEPVAPQDPHPKVGAKLKSANGGSDNPRERTDDCIEGSIITYRRKRSILAVKPSKVLSAAGRRPKFCFNTSGGGRINEPSQQKLASMEVSASQSTLKLNAWSHPKGKRTRRRLPSHLNRSSSQCTPFTIVDGKDHHRKPLNINLPKSSLTKELIRLGTPKSMPDSRWKDLRKRRYGICRTVRVLFSQHLDDDIINQQKKILVRLGISMASSLMEATHFVVDRFVRTRNMLEAIALGKSVVTHLWLESCGQASFLIDDKNYILRDAKKEKEIGFSLPVSLARANQQPLLKGQRVFVTPNIKPDKEMITSLVKVLHGQIMEKSQIFALIPDDLLILSCEEDHAICVPLLDKGAEVYSSELLLNGIVIQKLEYERHRLFVNQVERNRVSKRCRVSKSISNKASEVLTELYPLPYSNVLILANCSSVVKVGEEKQKWAASSSQIVSHFATSGLSVAVATAITHPLDVLKVRLQMQLVGQKGPLTGMGQVAVRVLKKEGPEALYLGLMPALIRSVLYGGLRLGLYEPSKYACNLAFGSTNILLKIASGAFAGALATALTNPVEVLKVRLQMNANRRQGGQMAEMRRIVSEEGVIALWKGVGPAMARAGALTASQLATYDETKQVLIRWTPLEEGFHLHLLPSTVAGTVSTLVTAPMDMVKTRLMLQRESKTVGNYKNGFHCAYQVILTEGPRALYKGGFAIFARLGPQTTITFILCEELRKLAGLDAI
ncbi:unnamed protein product [Dovyalis caffra]|uniref:BRCT domain-containing protein n=1 Tax=Dovyalis caffra TaxID=77055 RepID=A0AAV1SCG8_9ROSI|nr:unnamed protein product [Dovyalis caffra]